MAGLRLQKRIGMKGGKIFIYYAELPLQNYSILLQKIQKIKLTADVPLKIWHLSMHSLVINSDLAH